MLTGARCLAGLLLAVLAATGAPVAVGQDAAPHGQHGVGHAEMHHIYRNWSPPNNPDTSCCDDSDCRPTRAYVDQDGLWRAWNGLRWLAVPPERVLPVDYAGDGRSHLCEKEEFIYCFTPAPPRS